MYSKLETAHKHQITINPKLKQELESISNVHNRQRLHILPTKLKQKANTNLKQGYHGSRQHILPISNRGKLSKDEPNLETRGRTKQNLGRSCCLCP